jgi:hypothetical protein
VKKSSYSQRPTTIRKRLIKRQTVMMLLIADLHPRKSDDGIVNLFLPTVCASCARALLWISLLISRGFIETWQPYLAMRAFLEGDLSMPGSSISLVHREKVVEFIGSKYIGRSMVVNPSSGAAAEHYLYLQSGFL